MNAAPLKDILAQFPKRDPLPLIPPPIAAADYPLDALGDMLGEAARAIEAMVQCPAELAAQSVLAAASLAAQGHADVMQVAGAFGAPLGVVGVRQRRQQDRHQQRDDGDHHEQLGQRKRASFRHAHVLTS